MEQGSQDVGQYRWTFAHAEFDEARWELLVGGQPVDLERKPLELLLQLLRHAGEVLTKDELLESVWTGRIVVEAALTNAIGKLRKALGDDAQTLISTVSRVGYRLTGSVSRKVALTLPPASVLAAGDVVPRRPNYRLVERLARNEDSEVWRAEQPKTHEVRVFKFSLDGARLSSLKREVTLSRLLRDALGEREEFVRVVDWDFEEAPYFIESEFGGSSLDTWLAQHGDAVDRAQRLALLAETADAIASAHEVGILHKDIKPANLLVYGEPGNWHPRLTDFGSGRVLDTGRLEALGITQMGLTRTQSLSSDSNTGTPLYLAPEVVAGQSPSIKSDLYALGVVLYQFLVGDFRRPLSPGWEQDIDDPLLRRDIADFANGDPAKRPASARNMAERLRTLDARRVQLDLEQAVQARIVANERRLALAHARRPWIAATLVLLAVGMLVSIYYAEQARQSQRAEFVQRQEAERNLVTAQTINQFLTVDLLGEAQPEKGGKAKLTVAEAMDKAEPWIAQRFQGQPQIEGAIRSSMMGLYAALWRLPAAEHQGRLAIALLRSAGAPAQSQLVRTEGALAMVLAYQNKIDEANRLLDSVLNHPPAGLTSNDWMELHLQKCHLAETQQALVVALQHCQKAHALAANLPGVSGTQRADIELNLGRVLLDSRHDKEGLATLRHAVDLYSVSSGPLHPVTLTAKTYLVMALIENGYLNASYYTEGMKIGQQLLNDKISAFGPDDMSVVKVNISLAEGYFAQQKWKEAASRFAEALRIYRVTVGSNVPDYIWSLMGLGESQLYGGDSAQAVTTLLAVQAIGEKTLKPDNPYRAEIAWDLAMAELNIGNVAAARALLPSIPHQMDQPNAMSDWEVWPLILDGRIAEAEHNSDAAIKAYKAALQHFQGNASNFPEVVAAQKFLAAHHSL
jgi:DNA-binding winged helix-turn-helix (wHTH) protein/serine/threonine protein kinase